MPVFAPTLPADLYPDGEDYELSGFKYVSPLVLRREADASVVPGDRKAQYIVAEDYSVQFNIDDEIKQITVPRGMLTDLASAPAIARPIIGRVGPHLEASIVHDFLYIAWQDIDGRGPRRKDRIFADKLFLLGMEKAEVPRFKMWAIYTAVRSWIGWHVYEDKNEPRYFNFWEQ